LLDKETLDRVLKRGVSEIILEEEFVQLLQEGKPLRLKMGFDPSRPDIHLGHVVGLRKLRQLQDLGHKVILIVGDWTAQIGDPSGQSATRPMLTHEEVRSNAESYMRQFFKVVDKQRTEVQWQSGWFGKFNLADVIRLTSKFTVAQFLARDDFAARFKENRPIAITELLYPLLQAYDSVAIQSDVEFGGTDQKFNLLVGRELQRMIGQRPQQCFLMPLLVGTDGVHKMSKSLGNYIAVEETPSDMYGKTMSIPDGRVTEYFWLLTDVPEREIQEMEKAQKDGSVNPMSLKKRLAHEITRQFHGREAADAAQRHFEQVVQREQIPEDIPLISFVPGASSLAIHTGSGEATLPLDGETVDAIDLIAAVGLAPSKNEAKRLVSQGAVQVNGTKLSGSHIKVENGTVVRAGRRKYVRFMLADS
jgi:tyrosyl-tRNA synthetase